MYAKNFGDRLRYYSGTCTICYKDIFRICRKTITGLNTCCNVLTTDFDTLHAAIASQKTEFSPVETS